jgi:transposase
MEGMPTAIPPVTVGVDTHLQVHVAAVVDQAGRLRGTQAFAASTRGYVALATWAERFGPLERIGVEGTGTDGPGWPALSAPTASRWSRSTGPTAA